MSLVPVIASLAMCFFPILLINSDLPKPDSFTFTNLSTHPSYSNRLVINQLSWQHHYLPIHLLPQSII